MIYVYFTSVGTQLDGASQWDIDVFTPAPSFMECSTNMFATRKGCMPCPRETFSFFGWNECITWLNCSEIADQVHPIKRFHHGITKRVWHAEWNGYHVVFTNCSARDAQKRELCSKGMTNLEQIQGEFATRLIGNCPEKLQIVTMYYKHGTLRFLDRLLRRHEFSKYNNIHTRFQLSVAYLRVLAYLHNSPIGVRVMCDSPFLDKLLDQYLITDDFHLVVNDVDGLEEVTEEGGCHKRPLNLSLSLQLKIEQQGWPNGSEPLQFQLRPVYDEKIDIWKIPWVVEKLLGSVKRSNFVKLHLREIMEKCHAINPQERPTANEVLEELLRVQELLSLGM